MNYAPNKVIGDDEAGFRGVSDEVHRMEGWDFVIAGSGLYNNLDYSFAAGYEDSTFQYPESQPGGGSRALRQQLKILSEFINSVDVVRMAPDNAVIKGTPPDGTARALVERGRVMAIHLRRNSTASGSTNPAAAPGQSTAPSALHVDLSDGTWRAEWLNPTTGSVV